MFGMFKKGGEKKKEAPPPNVNQLDMKFEKTIHDLKCKKDKMNETLETLDVKLANLDEEIRSLISQNKKQQARNKIVEMKAAQKQVEGLQTKSNVLTQMIIQLEAQQSDTGMADVMQDAVNLGKLQQETNEKLQDVMMDWQDQKNAQQETDELFKQFSEFGVNNEEIDEEFAKYAQENEHEKALNMQQQLNQVPQNKVPVQQNTYQSQVNKGMEKQLADLLE